VMHFRSCKVKLGLIALILNSVQGSVGGVYKKG
jgi:hypothetical protein